MNNVSKPERATQDRVIELLTQQLGYRYLGNWADREGNRCRKHRVRAHGCRHLPILRRCGSEGARAADHLGLLQTTRPASNRIGRIAPAAREIVTVTTSGSSCRPPTAQL